MSLIIQFIKIFNRSAVISQLCHTDNNFLQSGKQYTYIILCKRRQYNAQSQVIYSNQPDINLMMKPIQTPCRKTLFYKFCVYTTFHLLLLTLFSPTTILMFWATVIALRSYLKTVLNNILQRGLLSFLPAVVQHQLTDRSIFDILCDLWFTQQTSVLKVIIKPFFEPIQPDHAVQVLQELSPYIKQKFLTKGIVNILPEKMKGYVVPSLASPETGLSEESDHVQKGDQNNKCSSSQAEVDYTQKSKVCSRNNASVQSCKQMKELRRNYRKQPAIKPKSFHEDNTLQLTRLSSGSSEQSKRSNWSNYALGNLPIDSKNIQKSVCFSQQPLPTQWDRLQLYKKFKASFKSKESLVTIVKHNISLVRDLLEFKKVSVQNISYRTLFKLFAVFAVLMFLQIKVHHKTRKHIFQIMQVLVGVSTVLGVAGTLGLVYYKRYLNEAQRLDSIKRLKYN